MKESYYSHGSTDLGELELGQSKFKLGQGRLVSVNFRLTIR